MYRLALLGLISSVGVTLAPAAQPAPEARTVTLPAGLRIPIRLAQSLDTKRDGAGMPFTAHVSAPVSHEGRVILPRGTSCRGHVIESKPSGRLKGRAVLRVRLDSIELNGSTYEVATTAPILVSKGHKKRNLALIGGGAGTGASIGAIAGGGIGAAVGAGAGAVAGTATAAITGKRNLHLPPETRITVALRRPVRVRV